MASNAAFAATPNVSSFALSVANTNFDGSGLINPLWTAGAGGGRVDKIQCCARGTVAAGLVNFFRQNGGSGAWHYIGSVPVTALVPSTTILPWQALVDFIDVGGLTAGNNDVIGVTSTIAQNIDVTAFGGSN